MILLTRPQKLSSQIAKDLAKKNILSIIQPLFSIVKIENIQPIKIEIQAILITSSSAIFALEKMAIKKDTLILVVGKKTAIEVRGLGYSNIYHANNSAASLFDLALAKTSKNNGLVLYLSGKNITLDLADKLQNNGFEARKVIAYETKEAGEFSKKTIDEIKNKNISEIWFYSQNTLRIFHKLLKKHNLLGYLSEVEITCLSVKIAKLAHEMNFLRTKII
ncbi:MAG: uroporphyrinogen-III synthase [Myxococcota bacterium]|jgi:uroporphyrinogen-III synthase